MKKPIIYVASAVGISAAAYFLTSAILKKRKLSLEEEEGDSEETGDFVVPEDDETLVPTSFWSQYFSTGLAANKKKSIRSNHFDLSDLRSGDGVDVPEKYYGNAQELMNNLDALREYLGYPITISSGYRSPARNARIGGSRNSFHRVAMAADLTSIFVSSRKMRDAIEKLIAEGKMKQGGIGFYPDFVHYDIRGTRARWSGD